MTLIQCPECGDSVSEDAKSCPSCGFRVARHRLKARWKARLVQWGKWAAIGFAAMIVLGAVIEGVGNLKRQIGGGPDRDAAIQACHDSIGQEPTLADAVRMPPAHFGTLGSDRYVVSGTAEMTYRSGLEMDREYRCSLKQESGGWTVIEHTLD